MNRSLVSHLPAVALAAALLGCGPKPCISTHDCSSGQACVSGSCAETPIQACNSTSDCAYGDFCDNSVCVPNCYLQPCPSGQTCNLGTHLCDASVSPTSAGAGASGGSPAAGAGSGTGAGSGGAPLGDGGSCSDNWDSFAGAFFSTHCIACHGQFASYASVVADATNIQMRLQTNSMPPTGGVSSQDQQRILAWIACGMPQSSTSGGSGPPVPTCPAPTSSCTSATWCNFAQSFFQASCQQCHSTFGSYSGVQAKAGDIQEVLASGEMPPSGGLGAQDLTTIQDWLSCGLPQ